MTFAQIQTVVTDYCGLTSSEASTRIGKAINRHYRRITASLNLNASRFVTRSATTTNGQQYVTFTEIEKIDRILDTTDSDNVRLLTEVSIHQQRSSQPTDGEPNSWALRNTDADSVVILMDTVPQTQYSLQADGWTTLSDLSGSDEPVFPESYHDILAWSVISEELLRKEKDKLAQTYQAKADRLLGELRHWLADSPTEVTRQGGSALTSTTAGSGSGGGSLGGTAYTQTALLTFDLGAGIAPFAVARSDAAVVTNLDADKLDGQHGSYYLNSANHTAQAATTLTLTATDRLVGRDTASGGAAEEISLTGGLEFSGSQSIRIADLGVSTAKIAADAVTYAKIQNISATSRILGRKTAAAGDTEECTLSEVLDFIGSAAQGDILYRDASAWARLAAGTAGYALVTGGGSANPSWADRSRVIDRDVAVATVSGTVSETDVYSYSVAGGTLGSTKMLRLTLIGDYLNDSGSSYDVTVKVKYGATTIFSGTNGTSFATSGTRRPVTLVSVLSALNATNAQCSWTDLFIGNNGGVTGTGVEAATGSFLRGVYAAAAEDSTAAKTLAVTVTHSNNNASISFRAHAVQLELI